MQITPSRALAELKAQHSVLRGMMERCIELADELDAGRCGPTQLLRETARLRLAFESHIRFEEQLLRSAPIEPGQGDAGVVDDMRERHVEEHRSLRTRLASNAGTPMTHELRQVIEMMREHLDHEERVFMTGQVGGGNVATVGT